MAWISWEELCIPKAQGGINFKLLKEFNLALLAKQGWKLQTEPNSFASQVLKPKYFTDCDFVNASLGKRPSYLWRSIMATQHLVRHGMRWRVGNGEKILVWVDKWLPTPTTFKVISPQNTLHVQPRVNELIDSHSSDWNSRLV